MRAHFRDLNPVDSSARKHFLDTSLLCALNSEYFSDRETKWKFHKGIPRRAAGASLPETSVNIRQPTLHNVLESLNVS
jgi:hypothetical protein